MQFSSNPKLLDFLQVPTILLAWLLKLVKEIPFVFASFLIEWNENKLEHKSAKKNKLVSFLVFNTEALGMCIYFK